MRHRKSWKELNLRNTKQDSVKQSNLYITGIPEDKNNEDGMEKIFEEIYVENFSKLTEDILSICESRISAKFKQDYYKESKPYGYDNQIAKAY